MQCACQEVRHSYKHKHLKAAFAHLPQAKDAATSAGTKARCTGAGAWMLQRPRPVARVMDHPPKQLGA
jgi:hypothetical protein